MFANAVLVLAFLLVGLGLAAPARPAQAANGSSGHHVVVISIDGMASSWYTTRAAKLDIPNLLKLKAEGSYAEGVYGDYPTVTYPSHTTIVTGRMPAEHGIYTNLSSRVAGQNPNDWFWFAKAIKVPTLWDEARRNHLTTASVFWPVTAGADIDWDIPEIWDPKVGVGDPMYVAKFATPGLLFDALMTMGMPKTLKDNDTTRMNLAIFLLKKYKPNLLLIHLEELDAIQHRVGPDSPETAKTMEGLDARVGDMLAAIQAAGLEASTDVFVVSDHGFLPISRTIQPNVMLVKAGLLTANDQGEVTGGKIATVSNGGSFFIYWPAAAGYRAKVEAALKPLRDEGLLWGELEPPALADLGADPAARLALEAPLGASFSEGAKGGIVEKMAAPGGTHGFLPFRKGLQSSFIAWGPDIKGGIDLHFIRMTRIGPTILRAMGINDPAFGSKPPLESILK